MPLDAPRCPATPSIPLHRYAGCIGPGEILPALQAIRQYCICDIFVDMENRVNGKVSTLLGFTDSPQGGKFVSMVNKDGVELTRWSHGSSEQIEVFNHKGLDIVFQISLRDEESGSINVRSSRPMPATKRIPAGQRMPVVILERRLRNQGWTWNFDWRWDVYVTTCIRLIG